MKNYRNTKAKSMKTVECDKMPNGFHSIGEFCLASGRRFRGVSSSKPHIAGLTASPHRLADDRLSVWPQSAPPRRPALAERQKIYLYS